MESARDPGKTIQIELLWPFVSNEFESQIASVGV